MEPDFNQEIRAKINLLDQHIKGIQKKSGNKFAIYTALTNEYDGIISQDIQLDNVDFIFICDSHIESKFWNVIKTNIFYRDPRRTAKIFKVLPHFFLNCYEASLWVDANLLLKSDLRSLIESFVKGKSIITMVDHDKRKCIYKEAKECLFWERDKPSLINNQTKKYRDCGYPINNGLINGRFILRKHNNTQITSLMRSWWSEIENNSVRDQISFNYVAWVSGLNYDSIPSDKRDNYISIINHKLDIHYDVSFSVYLKLKTKILKFGLMLKRLFK